MIEQFKTKFPWYECKQTTIEMLKKHSGFEPNYIGMERTSLDVTIIPQHQDPKLLESIFMIKSSNMGGPNAPPLYYGSYQQRLYLTEVPFRSKEMLVEISIWAFHEESGTCMSWLSKDAYRLFGIGPIVIELFDDLKREVDAWYRIYPIGE